LLSVLVIASTAIASMAAQTITNKDLLDGLATPLRWRTHSGVSYAIDGRRYVMIPSGSDLTAFALPRVGGRLSRVVDHRAGL
jgi:hypothetical protein